MPFYFSGSTLSLTILTVSKIYLMMRIKGDVSFQRQDISTQHSIPRNDRLQKARKISLFKQVLREIAMVSLESP